MIPRLLRAVFGSRNDRLIKTYSKTVARINVLEPQIAALSDEALAAKTPEFKDRLARGETLDDLLPEAFAVVREAAKRTLDMRHFDVQLVGGMVLHYGKIAEMRTGEGKTLVATLAAYLNALTGKGVHIVTVNDYLASRDAAWMGKIYRFLGLTVGHHPVADAARGEARRLRRRHHLRHQQRVRFRLPARQHGDAGRGAVPARPPLRDRRRGRLDPDRRGAHAAHHLGAGRRPDRRLSQDGRGRADAEAPGDPRFAGRLLRRREEPHRAPLRGGSRERRDAARARRDAARGGEPVRAGAHQPQPPSLPGAAGAQPVLPRPALRRPEQRGDHRRRVHRPADGGTPLVGRHAPGARGEGAGRDPEREPDARVDHVPELLPRLREARRHDRHRRHRGLRVPGDLQPRSRGGPDPHGHDPGGPARPGLQDRGGEVRSGAHRHQDSLRERAAGAGGHDLDRELGEARRDAAEGEPRAPGAERQAARP